MSKSLLRDAVYGAAVGDALGVPYEFRARGSFTCTGMEGWMTHDQPPGTWSDDTSMLIALCDNLRAKRKRVDTADQRTRFLSWLQRGKYTPDGKVFDVGTATITALEEGRGCTSERSNGNGSLMRIIPLAFTKASDEEIAASSAVTHAHPISCEACVRYVHIARDLAEGMSVREAVLRGTADAEPPFDRLSHIAELPESETNSSGYVIDTLEAALWCLQTTESYEACVLAAVNLGRDTDTTACVAGGLAGIVYGIDAIPKEWLDALRSKDIIERCLF